jgi:hypothetical protein
VSSIPNSAIPHARAAVPAPESYGSIDAPRAIDRLLARTRSVPAGAWIAGAAALGLAAAATVTSLRDRPQPKKRRASTRRAARRKSAAA